MSKFKILKAFRDLKQGKICKVGQIEEFSKERSDEINSKLGKGFIEEIKEVTKVKEDASKPKKKK